MSSIKLREIDFIKEWALRNKDKSVFDEQFLEQNQSESYFSGSIAEEDYMIEYDFRNVRELEEVFEKLWRYNIDSSIRRFAAVSAFKYKMEGNRPALKNIEEQVLSDKSEIIKSGVSNETSKLPEHIYVF